MTQPNHPTAPDRLSRTLVLGVTSLWFVLVLALYSIGSFREGQKDRLVRPLTFGFRHWLGRDAKVDPRLVIYAFTDKTLSSLDRDDLTLDEWLRWLQGLKAYQPRAVLFDRTFGTHREIDKAEAFAAAVKALPFPVYGAAFAAELAIKARPRLPTDGPAFAFEPKGNKTPPIQTTYLYGPHPRLVPAFGAIGHILNQTSRFQPLLRFSADKAIPYAPLLLANHRQPEGASLRVDGHFIPVDADGLGVLNFLPPSTLYATLRDLWGPLRAMRDGHEVPRVPKDATILVLGHMYTGGTDFYESPFGRIPGGFFIGSTINSVLTGQWLTPESGTWAWILIAALLGGAMGNLLARKYLWLGIPSGAMVMVLAGLLSFSHLGREIPWLASTVTFLLTSTSLFLERTRRSEKALRRLRDSLEGILPAGHLKNLIVNPAAKLEPKGRVLTLLFVDIVGFSRTAEEETAEKAFFQLKQFLGRLTETVHAHGGIVDKTLGDGLLAFFGHTFGGEGAAADEHADQALRCAIAIQRENARLAASGTESGKMVFPLRIGINTAAVFLGDLGNDRRIDLTVIGQGVNLAKRMESACESWKVLMGRSTRDLLLHADTMDITLKERLVGIKHAAEPWVAVEADPFGSHPERLKAAIAACRSLSASDRATERWTVPANAALIVKTSLGEGRLENFSGKGLGIVLDKYLGRGVVLTLDLKTPDSAWNEKLIAMGLSPLIAEVRWGYPLDGGKAFRLGLQFQGLGDIQAERLLTLLRERLGVSSKAA